MERHACEDTTRAIHNSEWYSSGGGKTQDAGCRITLPRKSEAFGTIISRYLCKLHAPPPLLQAYITGIEACFWRTVDYRCRHSKDVAVADGISSDSLRNETAIRVKGHDTERFRM